MNRNHRASTAKGRWTKRWTRSLVALVTVAGLTLAAAPAHAHVTANPREAHSPFFKTSFRVPHGCEGSATTALRIQIPEGVANVKPEVVPGWEIEITRTALDEPLEGPHGETVTERIVEVAWTGGELADEHHQEFGLSMRIEDDAPEVIYFPTVQECVEGVHRWIEIPDTVEQWGDLDEPAPYILVVRGNASAGHTGAGNGEEAVGEPDGDAGQGDLDDRGDGVALAAGSGDGPSAVALVALVLALLALALSGFSVAGRRRAS